MNFWQRGLVCAAPDERAIWAACSRVRPHFENRLAAAPAVRARLLCDGESVKLPISDIGRYVRSGAVAFTGGPLGQTILTHVSRQVPIGCLSCRSFGTGERR